MELITKLPKGKPPFIGILFDHITLAEKTNAMWINSYHDVFFYLLLEVSEGKVDAYLKHEVHNVKDAYKGLKFDHEKLLKFLAITREDKLFNFSHLILEKDNHKVVHSQVNRRLWVLKLNKIKVHFEY